MVCNLRYTTTHLYWLETKDFNFFPSRTETSILVWDLRRLVQVKGVEQREDEGRNFCVKVASVPDRAFQQTSKSYENAVRWIPFCLSTAKEELLVQNGKIGLYYLALIFFSTKKVIADSRRGKCCTLSNDPTIGVSTESTKRPASGEGIRLNREIGGIGGTKQENN